MPLSVTRLVLPLALAAALAPDCLADRIVTMDGRQIIAKKARKAEGGGYRLEFEHGVIELADDSQVKAVEIEGDMSDYEPKNDNERDKLEKGYVRYQGKWMSKRSYENELRKEAEERAALADEALSYAEWHDALEAESKHFMIRTNTSPELLDYYSRLLDAYYELMEKRLKIFPTPSMRGVKLWVNIYRSHEEFSDKTNKPRAVLGFFMPMLDKSNLNFFHDYPEPAKSEWVALHECTHLLTYLLEQQFRPQIWINEAVADYFGSATIEEDKRGRLTIIPGKLQTDRVLTVQQAIKDGEAIGLEELFQLEKADFHGFEYAHAWSFVYFLNNGEDGKYEKGFAKFFKDLYSLKGVDYTNESGYGGGTGKDKVVAPNDIRELLLKKIRVKDVEELEEQWLDYIASVPIDAPEARLKRGLRAVMMWEYKDALPDLDAAIEAGIEDPRAFASRARVHGFEGRFEKAAEDLEQALRHDPLNARYRYELSSYMIGFSPASFGLSVKAFNKMLDRSAREHPELGRAAEQAGLAMELDPERSEYESWFTVLSGYAKEAGTDEE